MTREKIEHHIKFLKESILDHVSGETYQYHYGKNKAIREKSGRILDNICRVAERYLNNNPDLFDFMVAHHGCDPNNLEYPEWNHIEKDTIEYITALKQSLEEI